MSSVQGTPGVALNRSPARFISYKWPVVSAVAVTMLMVFYRWFQQTYAWSTGLDSTLPEFDATWMKLLSYELPLIGIMWVGLWSWMWITRDKHLDKITPEEELRRYFTLILFIFSYAFAVYFAASFFAEQDASWHQTVVRDTSFTPSHIILFYGTMPLYVTFGVGSFLYAMTRLPKFAERVSIPFLLAVTGPLMIIPNLGFNEWGHAFWMMEEFFSAPLHWGFVVLGWSVLALGGLLMQIMMHLVELFKRIDVEGAV